VNRTVYGACSQTGPPDVRSAWLWRYSAAVRPVLVSLGGRSSFWPRPASAGEGVGRRLHVSLGKHGQS